MPGAVYVNGRLSSEADAVVPVFDHGFLYGEGVYEVCRTYGGRVRLLARHLARLRASAALIALPVPFDDATLGGRMERDADGRRTDAMARGRAGCLRASAADARRRRAQLRPARLPHALAGHHRATPHAAAPARVRARVSRSRWSTSSATGAKR